MKTKAKKEKKSQGKSIWKRDLCDLFPILRFAKLFLVLVFLLLASSGIIELANRYFTEKKKAIIGNTYIVQGKKAVNNLVNYVSLPSDSQETIRTHSITGMTHAIEFDTAKYLDPTPETETYSLQFRKQTPGLEYAITGEKFTKILLMDKTYLVSLMVPKEGFPVDFEKMPNLQKISTIEFGEILKVKNENAISESLPINLPADHLKTQYMYTQSIQEKCGFGNYCGFMQLSFPNALDKNGLSHLGVSCYAINEEASINCDSIIATLKISQVR